MNKSGGGLAEFAVAKETLTVPRPPEVYQQLKMQAYLLLVLQPTWPLPNQQGSSLTEVAQEKNILIRAASSSVEGLSLKSLSGQKYNAVIHCTTGIPWSTFEPNLSANGNVIDLTPSPAAKGENLDYLVKLVKEGKLKTVIDSKYPLSKAEDAWANKINGHFGALTGHATGTIIVEP
ncbi:oxidoreductase, zinc-binding dehydrogenase family protein [Actinidia rufa]|uniref:Oxidoreductase, zinc-binding dehydrogenase family protein n=1 Tax=Actinidia rufa TaxID=165716 RepID=A0A7J0FST0_9ERIC|nr:oxidoreductase, zinc-binding dehydrogenase family protein [Actinidia rufa]